MEGQNKNWVDWHFESMRAAEQIAAAMFNQVIDEASAALNSYRRHYPDRANDYTQHPSKNALKIAAEGYGSVTFERDSKRPTRFSVCKDGPRTWYEVRVVQPDMRPVYVDKNDDEVTAEEICELALRDLFFPPEKPTETPGIHMIGFRG